MMQYHNISKIHLLKMPFTQRNFVSLNQKKNVLFNSFVSNWFIFKFYKFILYISSNNFYVVFTMTADTEIVKLIRYFFVCNNMYFIFDFTKILSNP